MRKSKWQAKAAAKRDARLAKLRTDFPELAALVELHGWEVGERMWKAKKDARLAAARAPTA